MKASLLATVMALGLAAGVAQAQDLTAPPQVALQPTADAAQADQMSAPQVAVQPASSATADTTEQQSFSAFRANINPTTVVPTTGDYDQEDQYVGRHGFPLGGWKEISNPPS